MINLPSLNSVSSQSVCLQSLIQLKCETLFARLQIQFYEGPEAKFWNLFFIIFFKEANRITDGSQKQVDVCATATLSGYTLWKHLNDLFMFYKRFYQVGVTPRLLFKLYYVGGNLGHIPVPAHCPRSINIV